MTWYLQVIVGDLPRAEAGVRLMNPQPSDTAGHYPAICTYLKLPKRVFNLAVTLSQLFHVLFGVHYSLHSTALLLRSEVFCLFFYVSVCRAL